MKAGLRRIWSMLAIACLGAAAAEAQTTVTVDDVTAPTAPAFVVLDVSPASVERPETPKAFTIGILNQLASTSGLPQHYAVEVAPYWMASHPGLTFHHYQHPGLWRSIFETLSMSVATAPLPGATARADPTGTRVGWGVRTNVFNGRPNPTIESLIDVLHGIDDEILNLLNANRPVRAELRTRAREAAAAVQAADAERIGFFLRLAAGQAWAFPNDDVRSSVEERRSFWITPSYRFRGCRRSETCESMFEVVGLARGAKERQGRALDYGGRFVWRPTREFDASIESVGRRRTRNAAGVSAGRVSSRAVGILEYRFRQDLVVYASFGRDFTNVTGIRPLVAFLGLNIGVGKKPVVTADQSEQ
jgi:hypothetical protein